MNEQQPIAWEDVEPAHQMLATALGNLDTIVKRRGDLSERQAFRQSFVALNHGVEAALNHLTLLHNRLMDAPAPPARPLQAVLADIRAEGHETMQVRLSSRLGYWICESETGAEDWNGGEMPTWDAWCARVERGEARGDSAVQAAEARLADIRELHAAKAANPLASLNLTPQQVRENIERALARQDPAAAVEAVQRDADADAEAVLEQGEALSGGPPVSVLDPACGEGDA